MKKTAALIRMTALLLAVTLTLSGCTADKNNGDDPSSPQEAELIDDISAEEASAENTSSTAVVSFDKAFENIAPRRISVWEINVLGNHK